MERNTNETKYNTNTWGNIVLSGVRDGLLVGGTFYLGLISDLPIYLTFLPTLATGYIVGKKMRNIETKSQSKKK